MISGWQKLTFKQTKAELMVRIAATLIFNKLFNTKAKIVSIREITESVQYGYTDKASESEVGPKFVRITDLKDGQVIWETVPYCKCDNPDQYLLKQGDLIFARTGATTGKTHLFREIPPVAVFASYLIRVRPTKEINPEYLYFFFQSDLYWSQISSQKEGSAQPNVNGQKLSNIKLPIADEETQSAICKFLAAVRARQDGSIKKTPELPYPLNEQSRIFEHIEVIAARISKVQSLRDETIVETENFINNSLKHLLKPKENWKTTAIAEISTMSTGTTPPSQQLDYYGGNVIWYTPGDLGLHKELGKSTRTLSDLAVQDRKARMFQGGTILLVAIGASIGKVGLTRVACSSNQQITGILFKPEIFPDYGFWWMRRLYDEIREAAPQATLPIINQRGIGEFNISYPPLDEQERIVVFLDSIQARLASLKELQSETQLELDALLPSILDKAFRGEL